MFSSHPSKSSGILPAEVDPRKTMKRRNEISLFDYISRKISVFVITSITAVLIIFSAASYELAKSSARKSALVISDLVSGNIKAYFGVLKVYEGVIERKIEEILLSTGDFEQALRDLSNGFDELALGIDYAYFDGNGNFTGGSTITRLSIDPFVLEEIKKLKVGEYIFERFDEIVEVQGKPCFVKKGFVRIGKDEYLLVRVYVMWKGMEEILRALEEIEKEQRAVKRVALISWNLTPVFGSVSDEELEMASEVLKSGEERVLKGLGGIKVISPVDLGEEERSFSRPMVLIVEANVTGLKTALFVLVASLAFLLFQLLYVVKRTVEDIASGVSKELDSLIEAMERFRKEKVIEVPRELEGSRITEIRELLVHFYEMAQDITSYLEELEAAGEELEESYKRLEEAYRRIEKAHISFAQELSMIAEGYDENTGNHIVRVGELSAFVATELGLGEEFERLIRYYAQLHDIGKILVPKEILTKPGKLTEEEFEEMKKHTIYGEILLRDIEGFEMARNIALYHHEKYDGSGYPFGLRGDEIPIEAQIVSIVDVYDALRSERPYKKAFPHEVAMEIILRGDGRTSPSNFNPEILEIFEKRSGEIRDLWESIKSKRTLLEEKLKEIWGMGR